MALNEQELASLLDNLMVGNTDVIYFKDLESRFIRVNEACMRKHGWENENEVVGKTDFDLWAKEHADQAYADERRIIETGEPMQSFEEREIWPDGSITWVSSTKMPLRDAAGEIVGTFGVSRDITERKRAELCARALAEEVRGMTEELEHDVRMAGRLQRNFMPKDYPAYPEGAPLDARAIEFLHRFNLTRDVSGDYCAINRVSDHEVGVFLCDVQGVGVRAALGTALFRGVVRELEGYAHRAEVYLNRINALLVPLLGERGVTLDVTACYFTLDARSGLVRLASAGHAAPIVFHDGFAADWFREDDDWIGPALAREAATRYGAVERVLSPGDALLAFTDGLHGARNAADDEYGTKRLLDSARSLAGEPLVDVFDGLEGDALAFSAENHFVDDVCMVGLQLKHLME